MSILSSTPLITIITPTFNAGKFISTCIKSVQNQTFKDFEHIILDGQSSDETIILVRKFQEQYNTIKLKVEKDNGVFDAMNKGIAIAKGNWLYFLGADDYLYDNDVLKNISERLIKNDSQILYGNVFFQNLQRLYDGDFDIEKILRHNICHQAIFYHASVFKIIGNYNIIYPTQADYDFNLRCWLNGEISHSYIPLTIAYYADGGVSSIQNDEQLIKDYPAKTIDTVLKGGSSMIRKIQILSKIYRKILQRKVYRSDIFFEQLFRKEHFLYRVTGFLWMCLSSPFYFLKQSQKT